MMARMSQTTTPAQFARKWIGSSHSERAASQEHFIDLCPRARRADPERGRSHG